ncbi:SixA phosphatase family protein [Allopusillimonas ginsengisoli]|uniref:SixA phosphatase family protein n=1 Tax=Allopusillimonas ginsengisoli TaxID=453575 RepID=UPI00101F0B84|nr:histidine phosphatase family protein [Allopusillimonas ginsengisoli]TEA78894.1 histidine phosphatase family protein [Allopusillimonas ginsengisoli]
MLRLILLRHAKADYPPGITDHDRALTPRGHRQAEAIGKYMASHDLKPDLALVSTARRAQQTWALALPAFGAPVPHQNEGRIYEATVSQLLDVIFDTNDSTHTLLMVGHNPGFERLASYLAGAGDAQAAARLQREYPTAGLAVIDFDAHSWRDVSEGTGHLERFETLATLP